MTKRTFLERWSLRLVMLLIAIVMILPFLYVVSVSFSSYKDVVSANLVIFPLHPTLEAYQWVLSGGSILQSFFNSVIITAGGTAINMFMTTTMAYALSRKNVPGLKLILWMVLLTFLISPTMITSYLVVRDMHLLGTWWALLLPGAISTFNLIVMRQFFMGLPEELIDSARIDGASHLRILWSIVLPLSKASLAAIALFYAVAHWNSFFNAVMYINDPQLYPLTLILRQIVLQGTMPPDAATLSSTPPPNLTIQMAVVVITMVPILLVYPFLQKHFTKGVLTGSIKG
jgi:putative aldouronate transport system permease protein